MDVSNILISLPPMLFAISFHEFSHGYIALKFGDTTARDEGRLTLNPIYHLDIMGTLVFIFSSFRFGWAKPVPIDYTRFRNPKRDVLFVSLAGPGSNLIAAAIFGILIRIIGLEGIGVDTAIGIIKYMLVISVQINLVLAFFNFIPIPPLDGSKILYSLLPRKWEEHYDQFEMVGPILLLGLVFVAPLMGVHIIGNIIWPFVSIFSIIFMGYDLGA